MDEPEALLKGISLFEDFDDEELSRLVAESELRSYAPGDHVITYGEPGRFLGIILSGSVEVSIVDDDGARERLALIEPGSFVGEMSLLTGEPSCADVISLEETKVLIIPNEICTKHFSDKPGAMRKMIRTISERLRSREEDEAARLRVEGAWRAVEDRYGLRLTSTKPARILVINCGSSSLKYALYDTVEPQRNCDGLVERIGEDQGRLIASTPSGEVTRDLGKIDHDRAFQAMADILTDDELGVMADLDELTGVGHRVVHGGAKYGNPVVIDEEVARDIDDLADLAPLHNPPNLKAIRKSIRLMPDVPQVAVFDTGFHQKMPKQAYLYGLPYSYYQKHALRRYGFHGISHKYLALKAASYLKLPFRDLKVITCHLGNGASLCAVEHGRSIDTSMGLTPLEGLVMGTRCGDLDPAVVLYLTRQEGMSTDEIDRMLNKESGLKGLSGISNDFRELEDAANQGDRRALLAIHVFCYRIRKYIGAYTAAMGGLDVLVFAGGIGEHSSWARGLACQGLSGMGVEVDDILNRTASPSQGEVIDVSGDASSSKVLVIPTDEARMIARETIRTLGYSSTAAHIQSREDRTVPIRVSVHHVHVTESTKDKLFGKGYSLSCTRSLSQPGLYACEEKVDLEGPRGIVKGVRIYGPTRRQDQVEVSVADESILGIRAPIRRSGDVDGSPGITLRGPKGSCKLRQGVIRFMRHLHMTPADALAFGLKDGDMAMVRTEGERGLIFDNVLVRVDPDYELSLHIDVDEANAANIRSGMTGELIGIHDRR